MLTSEVAKNDLTFELGPQAHGTLQAEAREWVCPNILIWEASEGNANENR